MQIKEIGYLDDEIFFWGTRVWLMNGEGLKIDLSFYDDLVIITDNAHIYFHYSLLPCIREDKEFYKDLSNIPNTLYEFTQFKRTECSNKSCVNNNKKNTRYCKDCQDSIGNVENQENILIMNRGSEWWVDLRSFVELYVRTDQDKLPPYTGPLPDADAYEAPGERKELFLNLFQFVISGLLEKHFAIYDPKYIRTHNLLYGWMEAWYSESTKEIRNKFGDPFKISKYGDNEPADDDE